MVAAPGPVFVFDLDHDDRAVGGQIRFDQGGHFGEINGGAVEEVRVSAAQLDHLVLDQIVRQASKIPFRANIRSRPQQHIHAVLLGQLQEPSQILILSRKVKHIRPALMMVPHHIHR